MQFISPHKYKSEKAAKSGHIKFMYKYRDAGNYKLWNEIVFTNNHRLTLCQIANFMEAAFIQDIYFDPDLCGIERLAFDKHDSDLDHEWHEAESVSITEEPVTIDIDIADFLFNAIKEHTCWVEFDCYIKKIEFNN